MFCLMSYKDGFKVFIIIYINMIENYAPPCILTPTNAYTKGTKGVNRLFKPFVPFVYCPRGVRVECVK